MNRLDADLLVVGGGPVGLGTAVEAALAGMSVVVLERRPAPVDKACGEGLMPPARAALVRLAVAPAGVPFRGIRYLAAGAVSSARFRDGAGLGVRRTELSSALAARADELGVRRIHGAAELPEQGEDWVAAGGIRARWLVAADGLHSPIRLALGLDVPAGEAPRYGLRRHFRLPPWSDLVEVHWSASAEAYVTPVGPDLVGVAVLGPGGRGHDAWLADFPRLRERLAGAPAATPVLGAGPMRQRARRRVAGRVLLVGDAAGYVDALTGEGVSVGLLCARHLVAALRAGRPDDYEAAWYRASRRYRALTSALLWAAHRPALRQGIVPAAQRLPWLFSAIVNQLG